jgi:uncharacterized protein YecE (DUF72 family)
MAGRVVVGTSSWADPGFVQEWYPRGLPPRERLGWYAERFRAAEVNSTFYAVPARRTTEGWVRSTPAGFTFDVKVHKLLSRHSAGLSSLPKSLRDHAETNSRGRVALTSRLEAAVLDALLEAVEPLEEAGKFSSLLVQLSPSFSPRKHELKELDGLISRSAPRRVAVELRHRGWLTGEQAEQTMNYLSARGAALVCVDAPKTGHFTVLPPVTAVTCDRLGYLRAHGRDADAYVKGRTVAERFGYRYDDAELGEIGDRAETMAGQLESGDVRVMFNNNRGSDAPDSARRLRELLGQDPGPPPG